MGECMSELVVEGLAVLTIPSVHKAGFVFRGGRSGLGGVRVGFEGCLPNGG
jgi:lipid-binding SYLF domain-containing protein